MLLKVWVDDMAALGDANTSSALSSSPVLARNCFFGQRIVLKVILSQVLCQFDGLIGFRGFGGQLDTVRSSASRRSSKLDVPSKFRFLSDFSAMSTSIPSSSGEQEETGEGWF